jgi:hypothetical protein
MVKDVTKINFLNVNFLEICRLSLWLAGIFDKIEDEAPEAKKNMIYTEGKPSNWHYVVQPEGIASSRKIEPYYLEWEGVREIAWHSSEASLEAKECADGTWEVKYSRANNVTWESCWLNFCCVVLGTTNMKIEKLDEDLAADKALAKKNYVINNDEVRRNFMAKVRKFRNDQEIQLLEDEMDRLYHC